ncbi:MAG: STAS domain-containing protein [Flavobacteriales bacterium]|jgi:anti-anti-sigma factor|nr:STAS domain-containing protein [Flavobacteriales bacterium]
MEYSITDHGNLKLIKLSGRLVEKSQATGLIMEFESLIQSGTNRYLMSLEDLEYVNSSGLNLLIGMFTSARNSGGELVIGGISPKVKKLMVMTKLDSIFKIYNSVAEAAENF